MEPSKLYRGRDAAGIWHYGYFVEQWIYGIEKKYVQAIYKVGSYARKAFMERHIKQGIADYFRKFGL